MKYFSFSKILLMVVFLGIFLSPSFAFAQQGGFIPCGGDGQPACELCHLFIMFDGIVRFTIFTIVPAIAILMLIIGGLWFYFSVGDPTRTKQATDIIKSTLIGLLVVYLAWSIVILVFTVIGAVEWDIIAGLTSWDKFLYDLFPNCPK